MGGFGMKIAVTGASSYSGKYITRRLLQQGEEVISLTLHPDRPDPFAGAVRAFPLDFARPDDLASALRGVDVFVNTYWVRFDWRDNTQSRAVVNARVLVDAARSAGVKRIIYISITNPSPTSPLPYFRGKAAIEKMTADSGLSYAILRPTILFGAEDILINNIAFLLRHFPVFAIPGDGGYRLQPIYVDDLAGLAVTGVHQKDNSVWDAVGPDSFSFLQLVRLIGDKIGARRPLIHVPPRLALLAAQILGRFLDDVLMTRDEVAGLMGNLLVTTDPPRGHTRLSDWLEANKRSVGSHYASELRRHYS